MNTFARGSMWGMVVQCLYFVLWPPRAEGWEGYVTRAVGIALFWVVLESVVYLCRHVRVRWAK